MPSITYEQSQTVREDGMAEKVLRLTRDELTVMDGGKCILQLRGVRPFLSDKYDLTKHPNYYLTADADDKNTFNMEKFLNRRLKLRSNEEYTVIEA